MQSTRGSYASAEPAPPGPRGQVLFVGPFNGGVGGMERLTKCFAQWAERSGFGVTMVCTHTFASGPYSIVERNDGLRVFDDDWSRALQRAAYDFVYVMPAGLRSRRWLRRLRRVQGIRIVLDLDPKRKFLDVTDVLHCETQRDEELPRPHVVALPDPRSTLSTTDPEPLPKGLREGSFDLTVFTPYGRLKGHADVPRYAAASDRPLVWCYDPQSFSERSKKYAAKVERYLSEAQHANVVLVRAPSPGLVRSLYEACAGYVCFSTSESYGFALADALVHGKPLCARRVGICRALPDFVATDDFAEPHFACYPFPEAPGYEGLFSTLEARSVERVP